MARFRISAATAVISVLLALLSGGSGQAAAKSCLDPLSTVLAGSGGAQSDHEGYRTMRLARLSQPGPGRDGHAPGVATAGRLQSARCRLDRTARDRPDGSLTTGVPHSRLRHHT